DEALTGRGRGERPEHSALWKPAADMYRTDNGYIIQIELAGIEKDRIQVEMGNLRLHVYGERRMEKEAGGSAYTLLERSYGPFSRSFDLPDDADATGIAALHQDGVLTITIPREKKTSVSRRISIQEE
ncbi:MAG: Hsp20/alpha crystallin family protein, partial [Desulfovibrionales bacterium]